MAEESVVVYEPMRPSQDQVKVTEAMTGVQPLEIEMCTVCCQIRGIGDHHVVFRSHGGHEGPVLPLCPKCHVNIHEGDWTAFLGPDGIEIRDQTEEVIWRLRRWPTELMAEPGSFVRALDEAVEMEHLMADIAGALLPYQQVQVFESLRSVSEGGWRAQLRLIEEVYRYRSPGLSEAEKIQTICRMFTIRKSQVHNYVSIIRAFGASGVLEQTELSMSTVSVAAQSTNPPAWLSHAQARKLEHPQYSRDDLREEIRRAGARKSDGLLPPGLEPPPPQPQMIWAKCSKCGAAGWMEKLPVGSDGKPVVLE